MDDTLRVLVGLTATAAPPTPEVVEMLEELVFTPEQLQLRLQAQTVRDQAILALGATVGGLYSHLSSA